MQFDSSDLENICEALHQMESVSYTHLVLLNLPHAHQTVSHSSGSFPREGHQQPADCYKRMALSQKGGQRLADRCV